MGKRNYTLKKRAEAQETTRQRIVEALMRIHEEAGPKNATVTAIAKQAGVQRLTVYRHFPDEEALFQACTSRWLENNPLPHPREWQQASGIDRIRRAAMVLYPYYRATERMWVVSFRDEGEVPALHEPMQNFRAYLDDVVKDLLHGLPAARRTENVRITLHHLVQFTTWQSLSLLGLSDEKAAELVTHWVQLSA